MKRDLFLGSALGALAVCPVFARAANAADAAGTPIRFGYQATIWGAPAMVAEDAHVWSRTGANVQSVRLTSGAAVRDGLIGGALDAGLTGATPFIIGAARGQLEAVAVAAYTGRTLAIVVGKDSKYRSIADLKGARIASTLGSTTNQVFVEKIAPKFGLSKTDYRILNMQFQDMVPALQTGQIDAFAGVEPFPTLAVANGVGRILMDYGAYDIAPLLIAFNAGFIDRNTPEVLNALRAWLQVDAMFKKQRQTVDKILYSDFSEHGASIPLAVLTQAVSKMDVTSTFRSDLRPYLQEQAQVLIKEGAIPAAPDWSKVLRTDLLAAAQRHK